MPTEITMPRLSDTMEQGTVIKWNVKEGDAVKSGDVLAEIETDKATMELESFDNGTVAAMLAGEGESVSVGSTIVVLAEKGEDAAEVKAKFAKGGAEKESGKNGAESKQAASGKGEDAAASNGKAATAVAEPKDGDDDSGDQESKRQKTTGGDDEAAGSEETAGSEASTSGGGGGGGRIFVSPLARKLADDMGVDLKRLKGTGPSGRIVKADVEAAAESGESGESAGKRRGAPAPAAASGAAKLKAETVSLSNMRRTIARRLIESKTTIPHYQVTVTVDMDPLLDLREQLNSQLKAQGVKLSVNDFLVRACAVAMHQHPYVNSAWDESKKGEASIRLLETVNVGVAISIPIEKGGGLVVATLRDADRMGLRDISTKTRALAEKARTKGLTIEEQSDSTFTISNLGMYNVEHFTAIINPPNVAILAVGAAVKKPVVREIDDEEMITVGHEMQMTMSSDHRVIDGAMAAEYLSTLRDLLENPATLLV
ncbi:MAG: 2-oxo acid dehydrogenase subunit E2, partial [Phycisphaerales bacterium]